jgi:hypothetical protein
MEEQIAAIHFALVRVVLEHELCSTCFLKSLSDAVMASAVVGSEMTVAVSRAGALLEFGVALTQDDEVLYMEAIGVYATA